MQYTSNWEVGVMKGRDLYFLWSSNWRSEQKLEKPLLWRISKGCEFRTLHGPQNKIPSILFPYTLRCFVKTGGIRVSKIVWAIKRSLWLLPSRLSFNHENCQSGNLSALNKTGLCLHSRLGRDFPLLKCDESYLVKPSHGNAFIPI